MAPRSKKQVKAINEGQVEILDDRQLNYALLSNGSLVITETSFFEYLEFKPDEKKFESFSSLSDSTIEYLSNTGETLTGFTIPGLVAFCLGLLQLDSSSKLLHRTVTIFIMFLATTGLSTLIEEELISDENPNFNEDLAGLVNVPKPKS